MTRPAPAPAHDERIELRLPQAEADRWRRAAARDQLPLSEWIRRCGRAASSPSPVRSLLFDLQELVTRHLAQAPRGPLVLKLTAAEELILMRATKADVGEELAGRVLVDGPRCAFPKLFGVKVIWDAPVRSIEPAPHKDELT